MKNLNIKLKHYTKQFHYSRHHERFAVLSLTLFTPFFPLWYNISWFNIFSFVINVQLFNHIVSKLSFSIKILEFDMLLHRDRV